jgi:PAS domain S-box-containing protein
MATLYNGRLHGQRTGSHKLLHNSATPVGYNSRVLSRVPAGSWWLQSGIAVISAIVAFWLTLLLGLPDRPFFLPTIAVLIMALRGGLTAGMITGVTGLALVHVFVVPHDSLYALPSAKDAYELGMFAATALIISTLAANRRDAQLTLEATFGSIGDGVIVTDKQARVRFLNKVAEDLTGWRLAQALGHPLDHVFTIVNEDTRTHVDAPVDGSLRDGVTAGLANHTMLISRDGTERPISDSGAPIRHRESGRIIGAVLVFRDASAQRAAETRLKQQASERLLLLERERDAREEAERANRLKDEFLATLSHELRTPLNAVLGWAHMLNRRQLTETQQKQALAAIYRNAQSQTRLVDDVLDLSRIVTGRMALASESVDLSEIVRTTAESFTPAVLGKRQELRLDLGPNAEVSGDPHRLRQITWNLLSNATKFTPEEGVISCRVASAGERVELTVTDTGQGIEPGFLPYVFDRFRQGDSSTTRGHGGLGLGLALVRHLVEAHGGTVYATSAGTDKGATVVVRLPARAAVVRELSSARDMPAPGPGPTTNAADGDERSDVSDRASANAL